jgi:hypothetical protein
MNLQYSNEQVRIFRTSKKYFLKNGSAGLLHSGKPAVYPIINFNQFIVVAPLNNLSFMQYNNFVGLFNSAKPMSNNKGGSAFHQFR